MFDVYFRYVDGNEILCKDIKRIEVETSNGFSSISGEQLLNHHLRIYGTFHLYSDTSNFSVTSKELLYAEIRKK
jgi:hypothetical protein|nr:hypothetical protein [uncultured Anaerocolumna sp.]